MRSTRSRSTSATATTVASRTSLSAGRWHTSDTHPPPTRPMRSGPVPAFGIRFLPRASELRFLGNDARSVLEPYLVVRLELGIDHLEQHPSVEVARHRVSHQIENRRRQIQDAGVG